MNEEFNVGEVVRFYYDQKEMIGTITAEHSTIFGTFYSISDNTGKSRLISIKNIPIPEKRIRETDQDKLIRFFQELNLLYYYSTVLGLNTTDFRFFVNRWRGVIINGVCLLDTDEFKEVEKLYNDRRKEDKV